MPVGMVAQLESAGMECGEHGKGCFVHADAVAEESCRGGIIGVLFIEIEKHFQKIFCRGIGCVVKGKSNEFFVLGGKSFDGAIIKKERYRPNRKEYAKKLFHTENSICVTAEIYFGKRRIEDMERYAWKATIKEGMREEYIRRHNPLPEKMKAVLKEADIVNYTIWLTENEVFGYYECLYGTAYAAKVQAESKVVDDWNEYMKDVMDMPPSENGAQPLMRQVFLLE